MILCMSLNELLGPNIIQETNLVTDLVKLSTIGQNNPHTTKNLTPAR